MARVLITGAAGRFGAVIRKGLGDAGHHVYLTDLVPIEGEPGSTQGDLADLSVALRVVRDADVVVHTAGIPDEAPFERLLTSNMLATHNVFEAARVNGVPRVVFASSAHVIGLYPRTQPLDELVPPRPDSLYGVTKVFGEALGRLYAEKFGLEVICLRIGSFRPRPEDVRQLSTWLSPRDAVHLVDRCIEAAPAGFSIVYGVSANTGRWWTDATAGRIGYAPVDDAETFRAQVDGARPQPGASFQGGIFSEPNYRGGAG